MTDHDPLHPLTRREYEAEECVHRWVTAGGDRRDTCGKCGAFAVDELQRLTQRLAAVVGVMEQPMTPDTRREGEGAE